MQPIQNHLQILILQHPQEPGHELGTAPLIQSVLENCTLKVGLSWANLHRALGKETIPSQWAVLYRGTGLAKGDVALANAGVLHFVSKKGNPIPAPAEPIIGLVVLDGTWSQAKAMWWRNSWLLKLKRVVLTPTTVSLYGKKRKEPAKDCLSTIESVAETLVALGEPETTKTALLTAFSEFLKS